MKKFITSKSFLLFSVFNLLIVINTFSQQNKGINYQGIARRVDGSPLVEQTISLKLSIKEGSINGTNSFSEIRQVKTNQFGLFNVIIGSNGATSQIGTLSNVDWKTGNKFLQVEIDPNGGNNFISMGISQLQSVPFAIHAEQAAPIGLAAGDLSGNYPNPTVNKIQGKNISTLLPSIGQILKWDGTAWTPSEDVSGTRIEGPKGDKGDPGTNGLNGAIGPKGDKGDPGINGLNGAIGPKGDKGDPGTNGLNGAIGPKGDKGDPGADGLNGAIGPKGDKGDPGSNGLNGAIGPKGDKGDPGINGLNGAIGPKGDPGADGSNGKTILNGTLNPIASDGTDGDFFLNTITYELFGPKSDGNWPNGINLRSGTGDFVDLITEQTINGLKIFNSNQGLLATGSVGQGDTLSLGAGSRMMWYPQKAAFRVGLVDGMQWNHYKIGNYSFATGENTIASANSASAMGMNTIASGNYSAAFGNGTKASGLSAFAMGGGTEAIGDYSVAFGGGARAIGGGSFAAGSGTQAGNPGAAAFGGGARAMGDYSFAAGAGTQANGPTSVAFGAGTNASGSSAFAMGSGTIASGLYAVAFGQGTQSSGNGSFTAGLSTEASKIGAVAFGAGSKAIGDFSLAAGAGTQATGSSSIALGVGTVASGNSSFAMGSGATASGTNSVALGEGTEASEAGSVALGVGTKANGASAFAMGYATNAPSYGEIALGTFNTIYTPSSNVTNIVSDRLFSLGNGNDANNTSDALFVLKNGNTTINGSLTAAGITYPNTIGNNGQVLTSDGTGSATWTNAASGGISNFAESNYLNNSKTGVKLLALNPADDIDIVISPKGTGAILAQQPDEITTGGNNRGSKAVDLQMIRGLNSQVASGNYAVISGGENNTASGSVAFVGGGTSNIASGNISFAAGRGNTAQSYGETVLGVYSTLGTGSGTTYVAGDRLFVIGNGTFSNTRSNAITVLKNANTTIGGSLTINQNGLNSSFSLPINRGTSGQVLTTNGTGLSTWSDPISQEFNFASGAIPFSDGNSGLQSNLGFTWDNQNGSLNIISKNNSSLVIPSLRVYPNPSEPSMPTWMRMGDDGIGAEFGISGGDDQFFIGTVQGDAVIKGFSGSNDKKLFIGAGLNSPANIILSPTGETSIGGTIFPSSPGVQNQVLTTDGSGSAYWADPIAGTDNGLNDFVDLSTDQFIQGMKIFDTDIKVNNITIGRGTGRVSSNTTIGINALQNNTTGSNLVAIGRNSLNQNTTGIFNSAVGESALGSNTEGIGNTAFGSASLLLNTTGGNNTAIGKFTSYTNISGNGITTIGAYADVAQDGITNSTAIGYGAVIQANNTVQLGNTYVSSVKTSGKLTTGAITFPNTDGTTGQVLTTDGSGNVSWSNQSGSGGSFVDLSTDQTINGDKTFTNDVIINGLKLGHGAGNRADNFSLGSNSMNKNTDGTYNSAIGINSLSENTIGAANTALGHSSLNNNSTGNFNTAIGSTALMNNTSANYNVALGHAALSRNTTGGHNIGIGYASNNENTTGSQNIAIGFEAGVISNNLTNTIAIGHQTKARANNQAVIGTGSISEVLMGEGLAVVKGGNYISSSDARLKDNIRTINYGLKDILLLRPVNFSWKKNSKEDIGFIAQEVKKVIPEVVYGVEGDLTKNESLGVNYSQMVAVLTKAIQEQQSQIEDLRQSKTEQKQQIEELKILINQLLEKMK